MKIAVLYPKSEFTLDQQTRLASAGETVFLDPPIEHDLKELKKIAAGAEILAVDPDNFGGFEKAPAKLTDLMESLPDLKGLALDTTSFGWGDLKYCKKRNITVTHVPGFSTETVAEFAIALILALAKRMIQFDRKTQKNEYRLEMSSEIKGKTLGIIGLGSIGSRVAELGKSMGMRVIACNRSSKQLYGVEIKSFDEVLKQADFLTIHTTHEEKNKNLISAPELSIVKKGVMIVNLVDRDVVEESAMAQFISSGKVAGYAYEGEDLESTPLKNLENAIGLKPFGWYTKEALQNLFEIWTENIVSLAEDRPKNVIKI